MRVAIATTCRACGLPVMWLKTIDGKGKPTEPHTVGEFDRTFNRLAGHLDHRSFCKRKRPMEDYTPAGLATLTDEQLADETANAARWLATNAALVALVDAGRAQADALARETGWRKAKADMAAALAADDDDEVI